MTKPVHKQQQQQVRQHNQIKKCHSNRRLQCLKRRYQSKGMTNQAIEMLLKFHQANRSSLPNQSNLQEENKNNCSIVKTTHMATNISMLFENQNCTNQRRGTNDNLTGNLIVSSSNLLESKAAGEWASSSTPIRTQQKALKRYNMSSDHWRQTSKLIPNYKQLSPSRFKHILMKAISNEHHDLIGRLLSNATVLELFQQRAELLCTVFQLKIEQDYWNYIENLNLPVVAWLSEVSKDVTKQNFINWDHTKTKTNIKNRQQIINNKSEQAEINLFMHCQQPYLVDSQIQNENSTNNSLKIIYNALGIVLYNSLYYFHNNFEQKKILLNYDLHDAHLVKSFYDLNPTQEQIDTVQKIWRINVKSSRKILLRKKKNKTNEIYSNQGSEVQCPLMPTMEIFTDVMRTIIETRQNNIHQRTQQLMKFIITINDNDFFS